MATRQLSQNGILEIFDLSLIHHALLRRQWEVEGRKRERGLELFELKQRQASRGTIHTSPRAAR